jgi:hypothetical protein
MPRKPKIPKREPKKWLLWTTLSDTPFEGEEYLSEQQIRESIILDLVSGLKAGVLRLQPVPERRKTLKKVAFAPPKPQKGLDTPPVEP